MLGIILTLYRMSSKPFDVIPQSELIKKPQLSAALGASVRFRVKVVELDKSAAKFLRHKRMCPIPFTDLAAPDQLMVRSNSDELYAQLLQWMLANNTLTPVTSKQLASPVVAAGSGDHGDTLMQL